MPDFKQHGNILLGSLLIFLSMTLGLQFLATWILAFFMYYSDFIPYEYEQEIGKTSHLLRQNSSVPLKKNPPAFQLLSLKFLCVLPTDYLFYCHKDNKSSRKDHSARKWWQNFEGIKVCWNTHYCEDWKTSPCLQSQSSVDMHRLILHTRIYGIDATMNALCSETWESSTPVVNHIQTPPVPSSTYGLCDVQMRDLVCAQGEFHTSEQRLRPAEDWAGNLLRLQGKAKVHLKSWCFLRFMCGFIHDLQLLTLDCEDHNFSLL